MSHIKRIVFTGGGTVGHVMPNLVLIERFLKENWQVDYIGSRVGIEKELIEKINIPYYAIATGKLRRYFSWQNFIDPCKIALGIIQALFLCLKLKPDVVFSKGGFVAFPVVIAARFLRIPAITHESDLTMGLANKLCAPFARKICVAFPETANQINDKDKVVVTGIPIRSSFFSGDVEIGRRICGFDQNKKILLVFGGSLGADEINLLIRKVLPDILDKFQVVHVCGKGKIDSSYDQAGYKQFEYLHEDFTHVFAAADFVISRAGATSVYELIALRKLSILLPLSKLGSRGDQIINAKYCANRGFSELILREEMTPKLLLEKLEKVEHKASAMISAMSGFEILPAADLIYELVASVASE